MQKHGFKLQQVLNYRKEVEKTRSIEFADAKRELEKASDILKKEEEHAFSVTKELEGKQTEGIAASDLQMYANFITRKHHDINRQKEEVQSLDRKVLEKRETLIEASKDKKILEKFKDRKISAEKKEIMAKERVFMDEMTVQKKGRKS